MRERKQLIRAVIAEIGITVHRQRRVADLRIVWQGGAVTEVSMPMTKAGRHLRVTDEDTIVLVRRLARHYNDQTIAAILAKQKRRTATGLPFTRARVAILRANHGIPVYQPPAQPDVGPDDDDAVVVTITEAEKILAVSKETLYRWIRDGFITGRTDHTKRTLAHPHRPSPPRQNPARGTGWLARTRRGRQSPRRRPPNRVAQGPTRRIAGRPCQPRTPQRPAYPGQTRPTWTVRHNR